ncbi:peptidase M29 aminopeptidase II [Oceanithermus profundus DSM 14977]|uniref:Peptidase M29 aminopeptidase II n=1 Tax=Oceanithermus profundus (strain DSM 14977 / NBRC 100410 / VKM B-2274 / 506) TaxID=670487 RepID=E4U6Q2_OCEP5|nr:aminopeptidase [Oceanithermus profundus]ADR35790.1 peptidase M29 aminopeptidase II [Oceanithermus profundus DSM 14977]
MERELARLILDYSRPVEAGETLLIQAEMEAWPLLRELHREALARGAYPLLRMAYPGEDAEFLERAGAWLERVPEAERALVAASDAFVRVLSPSDPFAAAGVDGERLARHRKAWGALRPPHGRRTLTLWPTAGLAAMAGMSQPAYRRLVRRAFFLDRPDPAAAWRALSEAQARLIRRLEGVRELRIRAEGTDLRMRVEGRRWVNSDGRSNFPSGEVYTAPLEDSVEGEVRFDLPILAGGRWVRGVRLVFEAGRVVEASAEEGDAYLQAMLATDAGARGVGELGIGTNSGLERGTGLVLLDEKIGGTVHLALGQAYAATGGTNRSAIHWDLIVDLRRGGALIADGEVVQEDGRFSEDWFVWPG